MKMMAQMMGGGAGGPGGLPGFPPGGAFPGMSGFPGQQQQVQKPDPYTSLWRVLHAVVALGLGLYIAVLTPFTGTKAERDADALSDEENEHRKRLFFWVFATAESLLLSTRFFLDKGRTPPAGIAWTIIGYLPQPFAGYAGHALRYGGMFATVRADILACMFVLGVCSWWRAG
jgi:GET complex subunit GET2